MTYLANFTFPSMDAEIELLDRGNDFERGCEYRKSKMTCYSSFYPFGLLPQKGLERLYFDSPITILYGGNGSGKTTVLNIIAEKLSLGREALYNKSPFLEDYIRYCKYTVEHEIPKSSRMIASDDVFNYMLKLRGVNQDINYDRNKLFEEYNRKKYGLVSNSLCHVNFEDKNSVAEFERNMSIMKKSKSQFVRQNLIGNIREHSNGESAILYFQDKIDSDSLYLLDEPENSLSPEKQILLAKYIEESAWACDCQFIIATHSPFLLAMARSKIYDLDANPVDIKKWTELKNVQVYRNFFKERDAEFE